MPGSPWLASLVAFGGALIMSLAALWVWSDGKGRLFGSRRSVSWAVGTTLALAAAAAALGVFAAESIFPTLPPVVASLALPWTLCWHKYLSSAVPDLTRGTRVVPALLSIGILLLLDRLSDQMHHDMLERVEAVPYRSWNMTRLRGQATELYQDLEQWPRLDLIVKAQAATHYKDSIKALDRLGDPKLKGGERARAKLRREARSAYRALLILAFRSGWPKPVPKPKLATGRGERSSREPGVPTAASPSRPKGDSGR